MKKRLLFTLAAFAIAGNLFAQHTYVMGITNAGGDVGYGTTYSFDATTGKDSLLFNFGGETNSILLGAPFGNVIQAPNGLLYGMTSVGGNYNLGGVFSYDPKTGKDSVVISFNSTNGASPAGSLMLANNGLLYGTTPGGGIKGIYSVFFCYNPTTGKDSLLLDFTDSIGYGPGTAPMQASNGLLYGLTSVGGTNEQGTLYRYNITTGQDTILMNFNDSTGAGPLNALIQATNGLLYGMTTGSGRYGRGTMFCFNTVTNKDSVLLNFNDSIGTNPGGSLLQASNGLLYGMTFWGGSKNDGVIFAYNPVTGTDSIILEFNGANGANPQGSLIQASNGLLYGMTNSGGANNEGVIFNYDPKTGKDSILVNLSGAKNGDEPSRDLFEAKDGFLYGMTARGGSAGTGILFRFNMTTHQDSLLLNFGVSDASTENSPILGKDGMVYGMTYLGGLNDRGIIFRYNPNTGQDTTLLNFNDTNGSNPNGSLIQASNGLLYGLTVFSPNYGGVLFSYDPVTYKDSVLVRFNGYDGQNPNASLIQASDGLLYGTISGGGTYAKGAIFSFNTVTGKDSVLYSFNDTLGWLPYSTLTEGANKVLYGTAYSGGVKGTGTLFSYDIIHAKFDTLTSFNYVIAAPEGNLIVDTTHNIIYGATAFGSNYNYGALYSYNLKTGILDTLVNFTGANGYAPTCLLMWDTAANDIYGTTYGGGSNNYGVLFKYNTVTGLDTTLYSFQDSLTLSHRPERFKSAHSFANHTIGVSPSGIMLTHKNLTGMGIHNVNPPKETIAVYPNPASGTTNVVFNTSGKHYLEVNDITGRVLRNIECTGQHYVLNCSGISPGVYFIKSHDDGQKAIAVAKVIVE